MGANMRSTKPPPIVGGVINVTLAFGYALPEIRRRLVRNDEFRIPVSSGNSKKWTSCPESESNSGNSCISKMTFV